jgi:hypothetical protein
MTSSAIGHKQHISRETQTEEPKPEKVGFMEKGYKIKQVYPSFGTCCKMVINTALFILAASAYASFKFRA